MKLHFRNRFLVVLLAGVSSVGFHSTAFAQAAARSETPETDARVDANDIVVTAQRRSERLSDVPLSVTAATGEQLATAGVTNPADLVKVVPGFSFQPSNHGTPVYSIRGVGFFENSAMAPPTVSVYLDQVPLPFLIMSAGTTLDLERVEALKGPQGTLFGQNATGGAINFVAAKPTDELAFGGTAEYARFGQANLEGYVSGPISDTLHGRLAVRSESGGAWQRSQSRPKDRLGSRDFKTGRLTLDWDPSDATRLVFTASGWSDKSDAPGSQYVGYAPSSTNYTGLETQFLATPPAPDNSRIVDWDAGKEPYLDSSFYQLSLRGEFDLSSAITLYTISAYSKLDAEIYLDQDGTPLNNSNFQIFDQIESF